MKRVLQVFFAVCLSVGVVCGAVAQEVDPMEEGRQAFREGRYEDAANAFENATERDPDNAEAYYLLARVYFETPLQETQKAQRALDKALDLEPNNVQYLVGRLQQLRTESSNFISERIKEIRRLDLAAKILALDPENAFAHEELGITYIRDFWRYRNALMLPSMSYGNPAYRGSRGMNAGALVSSGQDDSNPLLDDLYQGLVDENFAMRHGSVSAINPHSVFPADRFDIETLQAHGVPVVELSDRAQQAYERAVGHLQKSLAVDPRRRSVYDEMMRLFTLKGEHEDALDMLTEMYKFFPEDPTLWRYLGLIHYQLSNFEAADRSFQTAFRFMEPEEKRAYDDLSLFLADDQRSLYEQDPVAYAARYWTSKDPRYLTSYNERKLAHYFRLTYADLLYGAPDVGLRGWETQRGQILVRYGPPASDVVIIPETMGAADMRSLIASAVVSNLDAVQEGNSSDEDSGQTGQDTFENDGRYEALFLQANEWFEEMNTYNIWDYGFFRFVFEDPFRNNEYRLYSPPASAFANSPTAWQNDYVLKTEETLRRYPELYEYEAPNRQVELPFLSTAFKGEDGNADLYVHYGIPITSVPDGADMIEVTANTGTFLINDQHDLLVERRRTLYGLQTSQILTFEEQKLWVDTQKMEAPPGTHDLSLEFETTSGGTVAVQRRAVTVPDFSADRLVLSDLLLAYRIEDTPDGKPLGASEIVRDGLSILPAPWSVFSVDQPIYIYFETYHLAQNAAGQTDYDVEIILVEKEQAKGLKKFVKNVLGGRRGVSLSFPGSGTTPDEASYQILDASDQEPGLYTIILRIRDNMAGDTVEAEQDVFLE